MKKLSFIFICGCGLLFGQQQLNNVGSILFSNNLPSSTTVSAQTVGSTGISSYYYWVIANFPNGSKGSPSAPTYINNAPNTLSVSNYVNVSWKAVNGATSYDLLRTTTSILPNTTSNIAVATAITGTTYHDIGASLTSYAVQTSPVPSTCLSYYDVIDYSSPQLVIPCLAASGGTVTSVGLNLSTLGFTVSGSPVTSNGTLTASGGVLNQANGGTGLANAFNVSHILNIANGGTGTATPSLVNGTNTTVSGTWPNQAVNIASLIYSDVTGGTNEAIPFFDSTGKLSQDINKFKWDDSSSTLYVYGSGNPSIIMQTNNLADGWSGVIHEMPSFGTNARYGANDVAGTFVIDGGTDSNAMIVGKTTNNNLYLGGSINGHYNGDPSLGAAIDILHSENNHIYTHGNTPTLVGCPASTTITGNDHIGNILFPASGSCTIDFNAAYTSNPYCLVTEVNAAASAGNPVITTVSTTAITIQVAQQVGVNYMCEGVK